MNLRKRIFLVLVSLLVILGIAACTSADDTVKVAFNLNKVHIFDKETTLTLTD